MIILSVVYINYNTASYLIESIRSIKHAVKNIPYEIIIVDNASSERLPQSIRRIPFVKIVKNPINLGYGAGANIGISYAKGEFVLVANPDVEFHEDSILQLINCIKMDKKIGVVGPQYFDSSGRRVPSAAGIPFLPNAIVLYSLINRVFPHNTISASHWMYKLNRFKSQEVPAINGACMLFRKSSLNKVGGFDERFFMYFEEADISYRLKKSGYKVLYCPRSTIVHLIGRSTADKNSVQKRFEQSRFKFFQKYHGTLSAVVGEALIRLLTLRTIALLCIIGGSIFLNFNNIDSWLIYQGDFARDMLAAREMVLTKNIPLLGIPSSVVWLHQGPLSIYIIGIAFIMGNFHPVAPAMLYAAIGVGSTALIYIVGKKYFSDNVGIIAAALYATSPLIIINARIPYHTAPIPFFTLLYFLVLWYVLKGGYQYIFLLFILLGLLMQLELSNIVLVVVTMLLFWYYRLRLSLLQILKSVGGFVIGVFPFVLYDISHNFVQLGGLFLWSLNRIRLFFGLTYEGNATTHNFPIALWAIWSEIVRMVFPLLSGVVLLFIVLFFIILLSNKKNFLNRRDVNGLLVIAVWLLVCVGGFIVHARPGTAYFPVIYPTVILATAYVAYRLASAYFIAYSLILLIISLNVTHLLGNEYFVATNKSESMPELYGYSYGLSFEMQEEVVNFIIKDAGKHPFEIIGGGFLQKFSTSVDNYKYLAKWKGARLVEGATQQYVIYQVREEVPSKSQVIYSNRFVFVVKNEKNN